MDQLAASVVPLELSAFLATTLAVYQAPIAAAHSLLLAFAVYSLVQLAAVGPAVFVALATLAIAALVALPALEALKACAAN